MSALARATSPVPPVPAPLALPTLPPTPLPPATLFEHVNARRWASATSLLTNHPDPESLAAMIHFQNAKKSNAVHAACANFPQLSFISLLLAKSALHQPQTPVLNVTNNYESLALHIATRKKAANKILKLLVRENPQALLSTDHSGLTPAAQATRSRARPSGGVSVTCEKLLLTCESALRAANYGDLALACGGDEAVLKRHAEDVALRPTITAIKPRKAGTSEANPNQSSEPSTPPLPKHVLFSNYDMFASFAPITVTPPPPPSPPSFNLKAENAALKAENATLTSENAKLVSYNKRLEGELRAAREVSGGS